MNFDEEWPRKSCACSLTNKNQSKVQTKYTQQKRRTHMHTHTPRISIKVKMTHERDEEESADQNQHNKFRIIKRQQNLTGTYVELFSKIHVYYLCWFFSVFLFSLLFKIKKILRDIFSIFLCAHAHFDVRKHTDTLLIVAVDFVYCENSKSCRHHEINKIYLLGSKLLIELIWITSFFCYVVSCYFCPSLSFFRSQNWMNRQQIWAKDRDCNLMKIDAKTMDFCFGFLLQSSPKHTTAYIVNKKNLRYILEKKGFP